MAKTHTGGCYCGAVEIEVRSEPLEMGYCHCENCRRYSAASASAFTLWKPDRVKIIKGKEFLGKFKSSESSDRRYCTKCGGHSCSIIRLSVWPMSASALSVIFRLNQRCTSIMKRPFFR
jgi:hypothetical protein